MFGEGDDQEPENGVEEEEELDEDQDAAIEAGEICGNCGDTFEESQGKSALCSDCWKKATPDQRDGLIEATSDVITE
jgi:protein-arginine kinase activator protein McsA